MTHRRHSFAQSVSIDLSSASSVLLKVFSENVPQTEAGWTFKSKVVFFMSFKVVLYFCCMIYVFLCQKGDYRVLMCVCVCVQL